MNLDDAYAMGLNTVRIVWLSTLKLNIDGLQVNLDCYGTEGKGMMVVCSKSFEGVTTVIEAWSF